MTSRRFLEGRGMGLILPVVLLLAWEISLQTSDDYNTYAFAPPSEILRALWSEIASGALFKATGQTLSAAGLGLLGGTVLGVACGLALGLIPAFDRLMEVTLEVLRPIPFIVLIPMIMMMLGIGLRMESTAIVIGTFWPNMLMSRAAVRQIEPRLIEVTRVMGMNPVVAAVKVLLPATLPRLLVAFRLALGFALLGAVSVEITANPWGLGAAMMYALNTLHPASMFAYLLWIALLGWGLNALVSLVETRLLWRYQLKSSK